MSYSDEKLNNIYDRTDGRCHICGKKLSFKNYANLGARGAWEVEHSNPRSVGGTERLNNLYPACISCNREKSDKITRTARRTYGRCRAPMSRAKKESVRKQNALRGAVIGTAIGGAAGGWKVAGAGAVIGALIGNGINPEE